MPTASFAIALVFSPSSTSFCVRVSTHDNMRGVVFSPIFSSQRRRLANTVRTSSRGSLTVSDLLKSSLRPCQPSSIFQTVAVRSIAPLMRRLALSSRLCASAKAWAPIMTSMLLNRSHVSSSLNLKFTATPFLCRRTEQIYITKLSQNILLVK